MKLLSAGYLTAYGNKQVNKNNVIFTCLYCLFVLNFSSHSRIFHSYGDIIIAGKALQILTYVRTLACHTYRTRHMAAISPIKRKTLPNTSINPRTRDTKTYCGAFSSGSVPTCFYESVAAEIRTPNLPLASLYPMASKTRAL